MVGIWTLLGKFLFGEYISFWEFLNTLIKIILLLFFDYMSGFFISIYSPDNFLFFKTIRQEQRRWADEQNFFFLSNHIYLRSEPSDNLGFYFRIHFHSTTSWSMKWTKKTELNGTELSWWKIVTSSTRYALRTERKPHSSSSPRCQHDDQATQTLSAWLLHFTNSHLFLST